MARLPRLVLPGHVHLVIHRGHPSQPVFVSDDDRLVYLSALKDGLVDQSVDLHAYALRPDAVRLLVTPTSASGLAGLMQFIGRRFVPAFNGRHGLRGTPWEGRFRSTVIDAATHFAACLRFVECAIPGEAMESVAAPGSEWSSWRHHAGIGRDPLLTEHPAFWQFGNTPFEREAAYRRYGEAAVEPEEVASILHAAMNGWVLGSPQFVAEVANLTSRALRPGVPGRPRKRASSAQADLSPIK